MLQLSERSNCSERRREVRITVYIYYTLALCYPMHSFLLPCQFCSVFSFEKPCVSRCRHDYGLRTSLAKEIKGQISIVRLFTMQVFWPNLGPSSVVDHHVMYFDLPLMKALDWAKTSGKLSDNILQKQCVCVCVCVCVCTCVCTCVFICGGGDGGWVLILPLH